MSTHSDYEAFDDLVAGNAAFADAAECHGALSGMLCVNRRLRLEEWLAEVFGAAGHALDDKGLHLFSALFDQTRDALEAFEFDFDLFLPDEDVDLPDRAEALSHWCKGFLHGLGSLSEGVACGEDGKEVLRDIYQIAQLQSEGLSDDDEDSYMELAEYLRVGVQLLRTEFQAPVDAKHLH
ncbi:UPF0149 family protein [Methylogaea oryzae]|uniref:YecA family protein n=1 Tax=Methylogaea oryzae TaxID=1295382 RepID=A0A8D5AJQ0_9GAMM|nr:UPF0149 family protein [Methylogaea oryzae]BBL72641.1 hypothetical protein MoryE10_32470 [Methylogaea oryzae]